MFASSSSLSSSPVQVEAPATLQEGSTFEAQVEGNVFTVTVPEGGVEKGDLFIVPYPPTEKKDGDYVSKTATIPTAAVELVTTSIMQEQEEPLFKAFLAPTNKHHVDAFNHNVPIGAWRTQLCDICPTTGCSLCCMGWYCTPILMAQVMQRMKFDFCGDPSNGNEPVCTVFTTIRIATIISVAMIYLITFLKLESIGPFSMLVLRIAQIFGIYSMIAFTRARISMRRKYKIKSTCCSTDCCIEDCCTVWWCTCCAAIQMASHTHDGRECNNTYEWTSPTGLYPGAPEIV